MAKLLTVWVLFGNIFLTIGQDHFIIDESIGQPQPDEENPMYSFGYGVADIRTGDVKTVWETKEGDTVKGHYSVVEPDGSKRTMEYSTGPNPAFTATLHNDGFQAEITAEEDKFEDKALRDYDRYYDFSEDDEMETPYKINDKKRKRNPYDTSFKDSYMKRPKYPDLEPSEYTHSFTINHPRDDLESQGSAQSHIGFKLTDPNCKTKHKKHKNNLYSNEYLDFRRQKYPPITSDYDHGYDSSYDKYLGDATNMEKIIQKYKHNDPYMPSKPEEYDWSSTKHGYSGLPDISHTDNVFNDYTPPRPKKKKPHKNQPQINVEDLDDYVLVRKKKYKQPPRLIEAPEYQPDDVDGEFDDAYEDEHYHKPSRPTHKEVVRKIVKKKKPGINILDIFDI